MGTNSIENRYAARNCLNGKLMIALEMKDRAERETTLQFGGNHGNDQSDAFRHCFWSALLAKELGEREALLITTNHEMGLHPILAERSMDLHNNKVGVGIGKNGGADFQLVIDCLAALRNGDLVVIR
jgi:hypothetical protein